jgi:hypothetical protein
MGQRDCDEPDPDCALAPDQAARRAWRQWVLACDAHRARVEAFQRQPQPPLPIGSRRALTAVLMARAAQEAALQAQAPVFPPICAVVLGPRGEGPPASARTCTASTAAVAYMVVSRLAPQALRARRVWR